MLTRLACPTVSGGTLTAWMKGKKLYITDENGNSAKFTIADVNLSNGVIHVVELYYQNNRLLELRLRIVY